MGLLPEASVHVAIQRAPLVTPLAHHGAFGKPGPCASSSRTPEVEEQIVQELTCADARSLPTVVSSVLDKSFGPRGSDPKASTRLLTHVAKVGRPDIAFAVIAWLEDSCFEANVFHYSAALNAHAKASTWAGALALFTTLAQRSVEKNAVAYLATISACEKGAEWAKALALLAAMTESTVELNTIVCNAGISACAKGGEWAKGLELLRIMLQCDIEASSVSYNSSINACAIGGEWVRALELLAVMAQRAVEVNTISYVAAMSACDKGGEWTKALELLHVAARGGLEASAVSYGTAISACEKAGQWVAALALFDGMVQSTIAPTTILCSAAMSACGRGAAWAKALEFLDLMDQTKVPLDAIAFSAAITACGKGGQWSKALNLLGIMSEKKIEMDAITLSAAISACENDGGWIEALALLTGMLKQCVEVDSITYTAAISACTKGTQWARALDIFASMQRDRVAPQVIGCNAAIAACDNGLRWASALELLRCASAFNVEADASTYFAALNVCVACQRWSTALDLIAAMLDADIKPTEWEIVHRPYVHSVQAGSALDCLKHVVLVACLQRLTRDDSPIKYVDTHSGAGIYDLCAGETMQRRNFDHGILRLTQVTRGHPAPAPIAAYLAALRRCNEAAGTSAELRYYLGSPGVAQQWLRPQDSATFFEMSAGVHADLVKAVATLDPLGVGRIQVLQEDSYLWLTGATPEFFKGRGFILIDPPYEPYSEYVAWSLFLIRSLRARWPSSCVAFWYPYFDESQVAGLWSRVGDLRMGDVLVAELVFDPSRERLSSSGVMLVNPPPEIESDLAEALPDLARDLGGSKLSLFWLSKSESVDG